MTVCSFHAPPAAVVAIVAVVAGVCAAQGAEPRAGLDVICHLRFAFTGLARAVPFPPLHSLVTWDQKPKPSQFAQAETQDPSKW